MIVCFSDIEMGAGGPTDDFPQTAYLGELIEAYNAPPFDDVAVTIVFNGDTFDLLKTPLEGAYPTRITVDVALCKLAAVTAAHQDFFEHLRRFSAHRGARRQVCFLPGNHDLELVFPEVQQHLRVLCGGDALFPGHDYRVGGVRIEHGSQADPLFAVDVRQPFVHHEGDTLVNLPWGTVALLEVAVPLTPIFHVLDRVKPRERVLADLPEVRDLLLGSFWRYWTRDYWRAYFADTDPMKRVSWTMLREIVYRFGSRNADVSMGHHFQRLLKESEGARLYVVGHRHEAGWWSDSGRKVLRTGCFRNEFLLQPGGVYDLLPKVYAEIFLGSGGIARSHLVEVNAPDPPEGAVPTAASLEQAREAAKQQLEHQRHDVPGDRAARAQQEAAESQHAAETPPGDKGRGFIRSLRQALLKDHDS